MESKLTKAFRELRKAGYFARQNWKCCQSCGCAAIPDKYESRYVFYHAQDASYMKETGECYLAWDGDGREICEILERAGFKVVWNGSPSRRIIIEGV